MGDSSGENGANFTDREVLIAKAILAQTERRKKPWGGKILIVLVLLIHVVTAVRFVVLTWRADRMVTCERLPTNTKKNAKASVCVRG